MKNLCSVCRVEIKYNSSLCELCFNNSIVSKQESISHPPHYNSLGAKCECGKPIECIDVVRHLSFNVGNVIKYCWRADFKGAPIEDLKKAIFYLQDEVKKRERVNERN